MKIHLKQIADDNWNDIKKIRYQVFTEDLGISKDLLFDDLDSIADQFLICDGDMIVGSVRLRKDGNLMILERMAILENFRKMGYGKNTLKLIKQLAIKKQMQKIQLQSIFDVKEFYHKSGFIETGKIFTRAGLPHVTMYLVL